MLEILAVQDLLIHPNPDSPAQREAYELYVRDKAEYARKIRAQALRNHPNA